MCVCVGGFLFCFGVFLPEFSLVNGDIILPYPKSRLCLLAQIHIPFLSDRPYSLKSVAMKTYFVAGISYMLLRNNQYSS